MHPGIKHLIALQAIDLRLNELRALMAGFPKRLAEVEARVAAGRQQLVASRDALTGSLKDRKKYELDVEQWKEKVRRYKDQIYEVKTNEAYKALQHEIQNAEAEIAKAEDRLLERMVAGEDYERQVKAGERTLKEEEAAAQAERQMIEAGRVSAQKQWEAGIAAREQAMAALPEDLLDHYQRIGRRHDGVALAEVRDETCMMCRVRVRPHVFQELRRENSQEIIHCESCTRILYFVQTMPAPTNSETSTAASADEG